MLKGIGNWTPANRRFLAIGLALTIGAQMLVLAGEYLGSVWPLWFGRPVILETTPIDPRRPFRGNYVRLNYHISWLDDNLTDETFRRSEVAYVTLEEVDGAHVATGLSHKKPASGTFIRGRIESDIAGYRIRYGIEAYFMPKEKALSAEESLREGGASAEIYLLGNGKAAIAGLDWEPEEED